MPSQRPEVASGFAQSSPGMMVMFAVFSLITSAMVLAVERKAGTLQRMLTTPLSRAQIIAGHVLAMFALVFVQELLLVLLGQFAFGVNYLQRASGDAADDGRARLLGRQPGPADRRGGAA